MITNTQDAIHKAATAGPLSKAQATYHCLPVYTVFVPTPFGMITYYQDDSVYFIERGVAMSLHLNSDGISTSIESARFRCECEKERAEKNRITTKEAA